MDNSSELRQEHKTRGQTGIRIDGYRKYMNKHVQDLMSSDMELDMVVMGCNRCDSTRNWLRLVSNVM